MNEPLITVIMTVYNTKKFLEQSIESVVNQTYSNLDIIIVDDGSTDDSKTICEKWAKTDSRINLICQNNCGPSIARNEAIKHIKGEYVLFTDSDDWMDKDMIEYLYRESNGADVSICGYYFHGKDNNEIVSVSDKLVMNPKTAFRMILEDGVLSNHIWNKLVKKNLVESEMFPLGKKFADIMVSYKFMINSNTIVYLPEAKYHYRYNRDSITANAKLSGMLDALEMIELRYDNTKNLYPELKKEHFEMFNKFFILFYQKYQKSNKKTRKENEKRINKLVFNFIDNEYSTLIAPYASFWKRFMFKYIIETNWIPPIEFVVTTLNTIEKAVKRKLK